MVRYRPGNWQIIGTSSFSPDPTPGDPDALRQYAQKVKNIGQELIAADESVKKVRNTVAGTSSEAAEKFSSKTGDLGDGLRRAQGRYGVASESLTEYAAAMEEAQRTTQIYLDQGEENRTKRTFAAEELAKAQSKAGTLQTGQANALNRFNNIAADYPDSSPAELGVFQRQGQAELASAGSLLNGANEEVSYWQGQIDRYDAELLAIRGEVARQVSALETAAAAAATKIKNSIQNDGLADDFWDRVIDNLNIEGFASVLSSVSAVLGLISLVVAFIPGLNVIAGALFLVSLAIGVVSLAVNTLLAAKERKSWAAVGLDVLSLATMGAGALVSTVGKGAMAMSSAAKVSSAAGAAAKAGSAGGAAMVVGKMSQATREAGRTNLGLGGSLGKTAPNTWQFLKQAFLQGKSNMFDDAARSVQQTWQRLQDFPAAVKNLQRGSLTWGSVFPGRPAIVADFAQMRGGMQTMGVLAPDGAGAFTKIGRVVGGAQIADVFKAGVFEPVDKITELTTGNGLLDRMFPVPNAKSST